MQDPGLILEQYGADALRLYLINSPVVRAESLRFRQEGVLAVVKDVFLPWYNAYRFLVQNVARMEASSQDRFRPAEVSLTLHHQDSLPQRFHVWLVLFGLGRRVALPGAKCRRMESASQDRFRPAEVGPVHFRR